MAAFGVKASLMICFALNTCSTSAVYHQPCSQLSIFRNQKLNLMHLNYLKAIVQTSCMEIIELNSNGFMSKAPVLHRNQFIREFETI